MNNSSFERIPPQNIEAEIATLGAMMLSKDAITDAVEILTADDFYRPAHATIFSIILDLFGRSEPADPITVSAELKKNGDLERVGGDTYLHTLIATVPTVTNAEHYAHIVREQAQLRRLVEVGTRIAQLGYTTDGADVAGLINMAQSEVFNMSNSRESTEYSSLRDLLPSVLEELQKNEARGDNVEGVSTGFVALDDKLNGLREGQMIIVAARPGAGKSTLAMDFCRNAAVHEGKPCLYFSLEMNRTELAMRLLAAEASVFQDRMIKGEMEQKDWERMVKAMERVEKAPLLVDDSPNLTLGEIRAKTRRLKQQHDIQLVVIDYLQLLSSGGRTPESRQQEVSEFSRSIKLLAKELEIPIVAVAQLNRDSERRNDKRPQVSDLRESGSLEQDADVVLLIHREDMYSQDDDVKGMAEIIVGKQRSGPTGSIQVAFQGHYARFANLAE
ncbi:replicative DNA helicase [Actinotignum urinale]|uniref:Replicative DNA helicase n=1 Tax=Actinotignum urinale TaxID=190146 RepID=A0AAW9HS68_9ACTO|nr:replicative DNA helicase [Actinotignum urinale]MDY5133194.1 replicative DNA helicase [Actinotignum urinale]MDY5151164.1 replicative DNA helicase [Actinotignum urinale]MDY5155477.1 replicative DNA helicase [Actinotignum urinale]MDY5160496.1 replicative DNA helicase [Actinotignum urinale]